MCVCCQDSEEQKILKSVCLLPGWQRAENTKSVCCRDCEEQKILKSGFVAGGSDQQAVEKSPETSAPSPRSASHF